MAPSCITVRGLVPTSPRTDTVSGLGISVEDALIYLSIEAHSSLSDGKLLLVLLYFCRVVFLASQRSYGVAIIMELLYMEGSAAAFCQKKGMQNGNFTRPKNMKKFKGSNTIYS